MTSDPFNIYRGLDPVADGRPDWDELGPVVLDTVDERARPTMTIQLTPDDTSTPSEGHEPRRRRSRLLMLPAAAALVAVVVAGLMVAVRDRSDVPVDETPINAQPVPDEATEPPTRVLDPEEMLLVGTYEGRFTGEFGVGTATLQLHDDGTFETTPARELCALTGSWRIAPLGPTFVAEGQCGEQAITLAAPARPERLDGDINTIDGPLGTFDATYQPTTLDRELTEEELAYVGDWAGTLTGPEGSTAATLTLRDDGTFESAADDASFFKPLRGHWELTSTGMLSYTGTSAGYAVRFIGSADLEFSEGAWTSSGGQGNTNRFEGTARMEPAR